MTCFYCNKKGHLANKCFKRISDRNNKDEETNNVDSEYLFYASEITKKDTPKEWFLDSGATMHMTPEF